MKKYIIPILGLIIIYILFVSFRTFNHNSNSSSTKDIVENVNIDGVDLVVKYNLGNMIDEVIPYGNKVSKTITITNNKDEDASFALFMGEIILSDEYLTYDIYYSYDDAPFAKLSERVSLTKDETLAYNLVIASSSILSLRVDFYGNNQINDTKFTGKLSIISNLSEKDIFRKDILTIQSDVKSRINNLNGINEKGYYLLDINTLSNDVKKDFKGFVLIDANDYSDPSFYYFVYNNKYMLDNYNLKNNDVLKKSIKDVDETVSTYNFNQVCSRFTKKGCTDFSNISYNHTGGKDNFYKNSMEVINLVKASFKNREKLVYVYDVKEDINNKTNIRGYILINNTVDNPEYYIYLTNDIYMVSGYNLTKLGNYSADSNTIRSYTETSFNLSSESKLKVCNFSGFTDCVSASGEKVY